MDNRNTLEEAFAQLATLTGMTVHWADGGQKDGGVDIMGTLDYNGEKHTVYFQVKPGLRNHQLPQLLELKEQHQPLMVVAEHIVPKVKEELRKEGIGYLETNGNIYFKEGNTFVWLDGQKAIPKNNVKLGRAFAKTGLKVVFHFLLDKNLATQKYRDIAKATGVGFGNINFIMTDLKEQGFLLPLTKETYKLIDNKELLNKWMEAYPIKLKPGLLIGRFRFLKEEDDFKWQTLRLKDRKTFWGGEAAGDLLTNYLKPGELTLYTEETRNELIQNYRMVPDQDGNITVYQKFWKQEGRNMNTVPPLLAYVDLMNTGDRRCIETAQKIYDDYLQDQF